RAGPGLREALAPELVGGEDRAQEAHALGVAAVADQNGPHQRHADAELGECGCAGAHALLDEQQLLEGARVASAECAWPVEARPPGGMEAALPPTRERNTRDHVVCTTGRLPGGRQIRAQPRTHGIAEREQLRGQGKVHQEVHHGKGSWRRYRAVAAGVNHRVDHPGARPYTECPSDRMTMRGRVVLVAVLARAARAGAEASPAAQVIAHLDEGILAVMKQGDALGYQGRVERYGPLVEAAYDIPFMAEKSLGQGWKDLSEGDRAKWI